MLTHWAVTKASTEPTDSESHSGVRWLLWLLSARGDMSGWLSRLRSTFVVAEPAGAGSGSPDDGVSDADETLRRFETVVPGSYESGGPPNLPTAPTRADSPAGGAAPVATPLASLPVSERVAVCASQIRKAR